MLKIIFLLTLLGLLVSCAGDGWVIVNAVLVTDIDGLVHGYYNLCRVQDGNLKECKYAVEVTIATYLTYGVGDVCVFPRFSKEPHTLSCREGRNEWKR